MEGPVAPPSMAEIKGEEEREEEEERGNEIYTVNGKAFDYMDNPIGQANRGIVEFDYDNPGRYMFHAHVQEFTDLGWMGLFEVKQENATSADTDSRDL